MPAAASLDDLRLVRDALNGLSGRARREFEAAWHRYADDPERLFRAYVAIASGYGELAAGLGADVFEMQAENVGIRGRATLATVSERNAARRLGWVLTQDEPLGNATTVLDELVKGGYRDTFAMSAGAVSAGWARVPTGATTCAFCLMLASKGASYRTERAAGGRGNSYHGHCDCQQVLVVDEYPPGYDPDELLEQWYAAQDAAERPDFRSTLAELRKQHGIH